MTSPISRYNHVQHFLQYRLNRFNRRFESGICASSYYNVRYIRAYDVIIDHHLVRLIASARSELEPPPVIRIGILPQLQSSILAILFLRRRMTKNYGPFA